MYTRRTRTFVDVYKDGISKGSLKVKFICESLAILPMVHLLPLYPRKHEQEQLLTKSTHVL